MACMGFPLFAAKSPFASKLLASPMADGGRSLTEASEAPAAYIPNKSLEKIVTRPLISFLTLPIISSIILDMVIATIEEVAIRFYG